MKKILVSVADPQLFLMLRYVVATVGFDAILVTQASDVPFYMDEQVAAAIIDWSADPPERAALCSAVKSSFPAAAMIGFSRGDQGCDILRGDCDLVLQRPFDPGYLLQFLLRLHNRTVTDDADAPRNILRFSDIRMNLATMKVHRGGHQVSLTALQFRLLRHLLQAQTVVCDREDLIMSCWPPDAEVEPRTVDIHIGHLRRALRSKGPDLIRTIRRHGYALQLPPAEDDTAQA